ncbi:hypothetical protein DTW90_24120 [Neorhizobium sp. P12A]|uniref:hypothetical protein n=1 Tax=Neorhizobium sp. P12A TaxID=2268027 RepID=UPI0011EEC720|nr:hypothetical protein [Neorhizobium sp. P12A]KAA0694411.1 hypothetical protein DTW90_24120 [Neorhizobium sp. P12A]
MKDETNDGLFASVSEDRREFGFQRDLNSTPRAKSKRPWLVLGAILIIAAAGAILVTSSDPEKDPVTTTSVH